MRGRPRGGPRRHPRGRLGARAVGGRERRDRGGRRRAHDRDRRPPERPPHRGHRRPAGAARPRRERPGPGRHRSAPRRHLGRLVRHVGRRRAAARGGRDARRRGQALATGLAALRPGAVAGDVDRTVRGAVEAAGHSYPHHTGHGLGFHWHEEPRIVPESATVLEPGMVVALEPGAYRNGLGVRVELVAVVTADGCRVLSRHPLDLGATRRGGMSGARPPATAIAHTGLTVSDLERSLLFWRDALGMREAMSQEKQGGYLEAIVREPGAHVRMVHLEFPGGGPRIELFEYLAAAGRACERAAGRRRLQPHLRGLPGRRRPARAARRGRRHAARPAGRRRHRCQRGRPVRVRARSRRTRRRAVRPSAAGAGEPGRQGVRRHAGAAVSARRSAAASTRPARPSPCGTCDVAAAAAEALAGSAHACPPGRREAATAETLATAASTCS